MSADGSDHGALRPEPPKTYYEGVVRVPGYGDAPNRCRPVKPVGVCDHGHTVLGRSSCGTRYCPDHWRDWCEDAVVNMVAQLAAYRYAQDMGAEKRLSHVVASPPQDRRYSARQMWETRSEAYEALQAAGVRGGVTVTHPYRTNERGDMLYETARDAGDLEDGVGKWRFLRESADSFEDLSRYVEAEPHYHALAAAEDVEGDAAPEGWIVKRIRTFDAFHPRDSKAYEDMAATAYYVLTHAADQEGRATTTYFGEVHSFTPSEELTAAMWDRIQKEAEKAVKEYGAEKGDEEGGERAGPETCPRDGCEAAVWDVYYLVEHLEDEEWCESVRARENGAARLQRLRGVLLWWEGTTDTPPPRARSDRVQMRDWLHKIGVRHSAVGATGPAADGTQLQLSQAVMGER